MNVAVLEMSTVIHEMRVELARALQEIERLKVENTELRELAPSSDPEEGPRSG